VASHKPRGHTLAAWLVVYESSKNRELNGVLSPVLLTAFGLCVAWAVFEPSVRYGFYRLLALGKVDVELLTPSGQDEQQAKVTIRGLEGATQFGYEIRAPSGIVSRSTMHQGDRYTNTWHGQDRAEIFVPGSGSFHPGVSITAGRYRLTWFVERSRGGGVTTAGSRSIRLVKHERFAWLRRSGHRLLDGFTRVRS